MAQEELLSRLRESQQKANMFRDFGVCEADFDDIMQILTGSISIEDAPDRLVKPCQSFFSAGDSDQES